MSGQVILLGTKGGPAIYPGVSIRMPTSSLVEMGGTRVVIDCGLGVTRALVGFGMRLPDLRMIVITHLHSDHYLELGPLLHTAWTAGLRAPVTIFGPDGIAAYMEAFLASMAFDIDTRIADEGRPDLRRLIDIRPMRDGTVFQNGRLTIRAVLNCHPPIRESYGLRLEADDRSVVFSGDTAPFDGFAGFARGADLLVHEAMLGEAVDRLVARVGNGERLKAHLEASHTRAEDAARIAVEANVKALALHHLVPSDDPLVNDATWEAAVRNAGWSGPLFIGRDGDVLDL